MSTGVVHPVANEPVLIARTTRLPRTVEGYCAYTMVLRDNLLAFTSLAMTGDIGDVWSDIVIWDWPTGRLLCVGLACTGMALVR